MKKYIERVLCEIEHLQDIQLKLKTLNKYFDKLNKKISKKYPNYIDIRLEPSYSDITGISLLVIGKGLETDEEYSLRLAHEKRLDLQQIEDKKVYQTKEQRALSVKNFEEERTIKELFLLNLKETYNIENDKLHDELITFSRTLINKSLGSYQCQETRDLIACNYKVLYELLCELNVGDYDINELYTDIFLS